MSILSSPSEQPTEAEVNDLLERIQGAIDWGDENALQALIWLLSGHDHPSILSLLEKARDALNRLQQHVERGG